MEGIARKYLEQLTERSSLLGIQLHLPQELAQVLCRRCKGTDGARGLRRLVQTEVEGPLASFLLRCGRKPGHIKARMEGNTLCFY